MVRKRRKNITHHKLHITALALAGGTLVSATIVLLGLAATYRKYKMVCINPVIGGIIGFAGIFVFLILLGLLYNKYAGH